MVEGRVAAKVRPARRRPGRCRASLRDGRSVFGLGGRACGAEGAVGGIRAAHAGLRPGTADLASVGRSRTYGPAAHDVSRVSVADAGGPGRLLPPLPAAGLRRAGRRGDALPGHLLAAWVRLVPGKRG